MKKISCSISQSLIIIIVLACMLFSCGGGTVEPPGELPKGFINRNDLKDGKLLVKAIASKNMAISIEVKHKGDIWDSPCVNGEKKKKGEFEEWVSLVEPGKVTPQDGEYTIRILPKNDRTGERGYKFSVTLDTTPPTIEIVEPENNSRSESPTITVKGTTENLANAALFVNGKKWREEKKGPDFTFENVTLKEVNKIFVEVTDRAGNKAKSRTRTVFWHVSKPTIVSPRDGSSISLGQNLFVEGAYVSGATVRTYVNDEKQGFGVSVNGKFRIGPITLSSVKNTIYVSANEVKSKKITVFVVPTIRSPRNKSHTKPGQDNLYIEGSAVPGVTVGAYINGEKKASGVSFNDRFKVGPITLPIGKNTIYVLTNGIKSKTITVFVEQPGDIGFTINFPEDNYITKEQQVTIKGTVIYDGPINHLKPTLGIIQPDGNFQYTANLEEGPNSIPLEILDRNNPTKSVSRNITIIRDTIPPRFFYKDEETEQIFLKKNRTTSESVKVVDDTSPLSGFSASWSSTIQQPNEGANQFSLNIQVSDLKNGENQLTAVDVAGNQSLLKLMKIPPIKVEVNTPKQKEIINGNSITVSGKVTGGYGNITITVGNQTKTPSQGNFIVEAPLLHEGENEIIITAQDDLEEMKPIVITVIRDTTGPVFTYAGRRVTSIDRWITEGNFTIGISDEAGIADVTLNNRRILSNDGTTWAIQLNNLKQESGNLVGRLTARDLAKPANEVRLDIRVRRDNDILSKAIAERNNKNYQSAIDLFSKVPDSQQKNFLTAQWNIATLYLYYLTEPDGTLKALQEIEKVVYERTSKAAYLQLFRGLAHFYKGEDIRSKGVGQGRQVIKEYKAAAEAFENAFQKRSDFSKTDLGDVWYFGIDKNVSDTRGYAAMSYYYLYKWSKALGNEAESKNYKALAIARLQDYVDNLPFTVVDGDIMIPEARKPFYKLEDFKYLYEAVKKAAKELDKELAKRFK